MDLEVDEILRSKRKARSGQKSCYPCRQRKVRCSHEVPCKTCIEREHPELCSYLPPSKRVNTGTSVSATTLVDEAGPSIENGAPSREEWTQVRSQLDRVEKCLLDLRNDLRQSKTSRKSYQDAGSSDDEADSTSVTPPSNNQVVKTRDLLEENVYVGGHSVAAMVVAMGKRGDDQSVQDVLGKSVLPVFGLDNDTATYPFVDLWGLPHGSIVRIEQLCGLLPSDSDCHQYFAHYRDTAHVLYPGIIDIEQFESDLTNFLINRSTNQIYSDGSELANQKAYGKNLHWVGLLFATLASGCQCSGRPRKVRQLTSQVFVCCAYECLRIVNYLSHSTIVDIQNLLVLGNVISNNMNAGVAWALLGLTSRLAQSQGLHHQSPKTVTPLVQDLRQDVWWQVIWQDSLLSITYDRASSAAKLDTQLPLWPASEKMTYIRCMRSLCKIGLEIVHDRHSSKGAQHDLSRVVQFRQRLKDILENAAYHLVDTNMCRSIRDQLEHWNLFLHRSYITSELCRPTINKRQHSSELATSLRTTCIESLADTIEAFIGLQNITSFASQSWAAVHRALSSALLLAILGEPLRNERARSLLMKLVSVMTYINSGIDPSEHSAPITRSIDALKKLTPTGMSSVPGPTMSLTGTPTYEQSDMDFYTAHSSPSFILGAQETSPYSIMDTILWGEKQMPSAP
ncbi:hypothetical protein EJ08DRAFT_589314 [Tothia fuscella]|uniref:Zn(2)-C6 fungal-type domain-containing protein n=1 Tax=Tothia fuscella TaxID=1048955 RepID=A0A9P4NRH1_9PEZI|nr:hypothetical protein EJ08DRAFT_589314 [Tothia fuscella]